MQLAQRSLNVYTKEVSVEIILLFLLATLAINTVCLITEKTRQIFQHLSNFGFLTVISVWNYKLMGDRLSSVVYLFSRQQWNWHTCPALQCGKACVIVELGIVAPH